MKSILKVDQAQKIRKGLFNIDLNLPGINLRNPQDPRGFAQLGRFDHAHLYPGVFVGMHPHKNDEILTYMREGEMVHEDTEGKTVTISNKRLMMMNAGRGIYHQESIPEKGKEVKLLQIFMRPEKEDNKPRVQFADFDSPYSINSWRLVAGEQANNPPLVIDSTVNVFDARLERTSIRLLNKVGKSYLLHVFDGRLTIGEHSLTEGDSLIYKEENLTALATEVTDLVLFELDESATYSRNGMYSGV